MQLENLKNHRSLRPLKFPLDETPHATIEPNKTCNIRCRLCYNLSRNTVKSLAEVQEEIGLASKKRTLQTITLLGGEPTLHPELKEIVAEVKSRGLFCQLLTNGVAFLADGGDHLLDELVSSGIDRFIFHVDEGQSHIHPDIEDVRRVLFAKCEAKGARFSLALTLYDGCAEIIPPLMRAYSRYVFFDGILAVLARDPRETLPAQVSFLEVYRSISDELRIDPVDYIPSNLSDDDVRWLTYFYFINAHSGRTFGVSPRLNRIWRKVYRLWKRKHLFILQLKPFPTRAFIMLTSLLDICLHAGKMPEFVRFIRGSSFLKAVRFHYLAIQTPPELHSQKNELQFCYHCPDATVRNGKLVPVCVADFLDPLDSAVEGGLGRPVWHRAVYQHLGEIPPGP